MPRPAASRAPFRTILCPVDFSRYSRRALRYAAGLAQWSGARLVTLFVGDPLLLAAAQSVSGSREAFLERAGKELREFVAGALARTALDPASVAYLTASGEPPREITAAARRQGADLIVMGAQGLGGVSKLLFGSTTARVLAEAGTPVLAIPPRARPARGAIPLSGPGRRIVAPLDLTGRARGDVAKAAALARSSEAELVLLHVVPPTGAPRWARKRVAAHDRSRAKTARDRLRALAASVPQDVSVKVLVLQGKISEEIAALAAKKSTGLLLLSGRKGPGFFGHQRGAIAYHALRRARSPVLVLPDPSR